MSIQKEARRDAREYARAQMFYGEGAGTRRKLITNTVAGKAEFKPGYAQAFNQELSKQDMAEHAEAARKERRRVDATHAVSKNTKALVTGNYAGANVSVLVVAGLAYLAHQTGYDKKIVDKVKTKYKHFKIKREARRMAHENLVTRITTL